MATIEHTVPHDSVDGPDGVRAWRKAARRVFERVEMLSDSHSHSLAVFRLAGPGDEEELKELAGRVWDTVEDSDWPEAGHE